MPYTNTVVVSTKPPSFTIKFALSPMQIKIEENVNRLKMRIEYFCIFVEQSNGQEVVVYKMDSKWSNVKLQPSIRCVPRPIS